MILYNKLNSVLFKEELFEDKHSTNLFFIITHDKLRDPNTEIVEEEDDAKILYKFAVGKELQNILEE